MNQITPEQEHKIIILASEIAKSIVPVEEILQQLNITQEEWDFISRTKTFNEVLTASSAEWMSATNTHKRAKLKAAAVIETVLPIFYDDMIDRKNKLSDRAKVLETVAKVAGLGTPDPQATPSGNMFRLQINFANKPPIILENTGDGHYSGSNSTDDELEPAQISQEFEGQPLEDL